MRCFRLTFRKKFFIKNFQLCMVSNGEYIHIHQQMFKSIWYFILLLYGCGFEKAKSVERNGQCYVRILNYVEYMLCMNKTIPHNKTEGKEKLYIHWFYSKSVKNSFTNDVSWFCSLEKQLYSVAMVSSLQCYSVAMVSSLVSCFVQHVFH